MIHAWVLNQKETTNNLTVFAEMVARHNVTGRTGHEDYRITRPDVDHHREGSERYYRDYIAANSNDDASLPAGAG